jgi:hypothetical protein
MMLGREDIQQDRFMHILTVLSPEDQIAIGGIPGEAIAGLIGGPVNDPDDLAKREGFSLDEFRPNPTFSAFMQQGDSHLWPGRSRVTGSCTTAWFISATSIFARGAYS